MHRNTFQTGRALALTLGVCLTMGACAGKDEGAAGDSASAATDTAMAANGTAATGTMGEAAAPRNDGEIMTMISHSNAAEISSSELAQQKATNPQVKAYAQQMITEHTAMQKEGDRIAKANNAAPAGTDATMDKKEDAQDDIGDLKDKSGADFDKAYMEYQVKAHEMTLAQLQGMQNTAQNADLKAMITAAIPKVQAHLEKAQQIRQQLQNTQS